MIARVKAECDGLESTFRKSLTSNHCKSHPTFKIRARRKRLMHFEKILCSKWTGNSVFDHLVLNMS